ncbi:MAG: phytanoyl-CoA dioxygenase family protein, partial [Alphaproteobacteria bacterium]|nr:phytanoyl-CoA dioxygenase family protein [Alphaproteobacteria bacterium]
MEPFLDSTDIAKDGSALAARMERDGYLFIRGLVPVAAVDNVARQFLEVAADGGWLNPEFPTSARIANPKATCADPEPAFLDVFRRFYRLEDTHALKHHPAIIALFERMFGEQVLVHPLLVARNIFPRRKALTTRPHQDYVHFQGTPATYTVWLPLQDCPLEMGGLSVAEGSHRQGVHDFTVASGAGGLETMEPFADKWRGGDFALGDALIFHSMLVHKGLDNRTDRLRHSLDSRYQRASEPISAVSMDAYAGCGGWDEIYADWKSDELKYYWRAQNPKIQPLDYQYYHPRDEIAFYLAAAGDETGPSAPLRSVPRDPRAPTPRPAPPRVCVLGSPTNPAPA